VKGLLIVNYCLVTRMLEAKYVLLQLYSCR